ncbi:hypothetical protein K438DRAFT_1987836 [Mycena galopus ATCC 62051]|nr:hypothetical protein K438DRAFT_1987836 [Mycena galopus ATCC 62051]
MIPLHIPRPAHAPPAIDARPARYCAPTRHDPPKITPRPSALPAFLHTFLRHAVCMCYPPPAPPCVFLLSRPRRSLPGLAPPILLGRTLRQAYLSAPTPSSVCPPCAAHARAARYCAPTRHDPPKITPRPSALPAFLHTFLRHAVCMCYPPPAPPCVFLLSRPRRSLPGLAPPILLGRTLRQAYLSAPTPSSCALAHPRRALRTSARCTAPTPSPESFLRDAPQAPCTLTSPVAVARRPNTRRPAPTALCVPVCAAAGPTYGLSRFVGIYPGRRACARRRSCCADPVRTGPPPHGAPSCSAHPPAARCCCADPGHFGPPPTPHCVPACPLPGPFCLLQACVHDVVWFINMYLVV